MVEVRQLFSGSCCGGELYGRGCDACSMQGSLQQAAVGAECGGKLEPDCVESSCFGVCIGQALPLCISGVH